MELSEKIIAQLESEGFTDIYEWYDEPNTVHGEHSHDNEHSIVVVEGEITFTTDAGDITLGPSERIDVAPSTTHTARVGSSGCKYVVGER